MLSEIIRCHNCECPFELQREFISRNAVIMFCKACHECEYRDERQPEPDEDGYVIWDTKYKKDRKHKEHREDLTYRAIKAIHEYVIHTYDSIPDGWQERTYNVIRKLDYVDDVNEVHLTRTLRICYRIATQHSHQETLDVCEKTLKKLGASEQDMQNMLEGIQCA